MGELEAFFGVARVAFIGGSLVPVGGHNLLEAVRAGAAVVMGPHRHNIDDIARQFLDHSAMQVVADGQALETRVIELMRNEDQTRRMTANASEVLAQNRGALHRVHALLMTLVDDSLMMRAGAD